MFGTIFDFEGDGLYPTKIHVVSHTDGDNLESSNDYDEIRKVLLENDVLVGHNIARFDVPHLERLLEIEVPKETLIVDTLAVSWYLYPKRSRHNLEGYGEEYGIKKPEVDDWINLDYSTYKFRCESDVQINQKLWDDQYKYLLKLYGDHENVVAFLRYLAFKMDCAREQERSKWRLDIPRCEAALAKLEALQKEKTDELFQALPPVPIVAQRRRPSKPYKANGEPSGAGIRWFKLLESKGLPLSHADPVDEITGYDEPNPGSHEQIKQWLFGLGWRPETFKENKKKKSIPQINKSKQDGGGICDSVKILYEKEPRVELLDNLFVLGHRIGILRGFLENQVDGYVTARVMGLTNTLRFKHTEVVNLPKIDAPFGEDIRGCLIADEGYELCGSDMSSLEDRTKQHYMWKYDPEYVKEMMTPDFDPHLSLAEFAGKLTKKQVEEYKSGVYEPWIKTLRGIFKNTNYAATYNAFPPKIAQTAGVSLKEGQELFDAYWKKNWSIKAVAASVKTKRIGDQDWLYNPVSSFWYCLRKERDKFSTLNQSTGVFCFDTWVAFVRRRRPQLTATFHDEIIIHVKQGYRDGVKEFLLECIEEANEALGLNRRLDIGIEFGNAYSEIH